MSHINPFNLKAAELGERLKGTRSLLPELDEARNATAVLRAAPQTQTILAQTQALLAKIKDIPITPYTAYRRFARDGDREEFETPYILKRWNLSAIALRHFLGVGEYKSLVQDYIWNICEETNWVLPAHEQRGIDLFSAETGLLLTETLALLGSSIDEEVRHRVYVEVDRRLFEPYFRFHDSYGWYKGDNNWNGVCNSSIAAAFLLLEPDPARVTHGLELALQGLEIFLDSAFEQDGSSTEGVSYWHYGFMNFVLLSEMLYARSGGALNLLASEHARLICAYPAKMQLSGAMYASFSDCDESVDFNPGIIARLAQRTGEPSLLNLLAKPAAPASNGILPMMLRNVLWWDGVQPDTPAIADAILPNGSMARFVTRTIAGAPIVLAVKAGHNGENHNQNDVGSFILHVDGENLLTDPGPGLYSRQYFSAERYENIFANSFGHSVPRISGSLQATGREYFGTLQAANDANGLKRITIEFARAYPLTNLLSLQRQFIIDSQTEQAGEIWLQDEVGFSGEVGEVEEALVTWLRVDIDGSTATIHGHRHLLSVVIEEPTGVQFKLESLQEQSMANAKSEVLQRLSFVIPPATHSTIRMRMVVASIQRKFTR
jgi:Heparinase II/III-like protein